jgi:hypothetical protein
MMGLSLIPSLPISPWLGLIRTPSGAQTRETPSRSMGSGQRIDNVQSSCLATRLSRIRRCLDFSLLANSCSSVYAKISSGSSTSTGNDSGDSGCSLYFAINRSMASAAISACAFGLNVFRIFRARSSGH